MKILLVSDQDFLAESILQRLYKEGNQVFLLTLRKGSSFQNRSQDLRVYEYDSESSIHSIFLSANPDAVIFAGAGYLSPVYGEMQQNNLTLLLKLLEEARITSISSFLLLSSTDVYGRLEGNLTEETLPQPDTEKGSFFLQLEQMLESYHQRYRLPGAILRLGPVFGETLDPRCPQWLTAMEQEALESNVNGDCWIQPICSLDAADAMVRILAAPSFCIYNVCASQPILKSHILDLLREEGQTQESSNPGERRISCENLRKLQWHDLWTFEDFLRDGRIHRISVSEKPKKQFLPAAPVQIRHTAANLLLLSFFTLLTLCSSNLPLLSSVHWLLIYVIAAALCLGLRQGSLAALLASCISLMTVSPGQSDWIPSILEFFCCGIFIGYIVDELRQNLRRMQKQKEELEISYEKLQSINHKNLFLKNEYEKRLLQSSTTIPSLYSIISKISVLDTQRIFVELLQVVRELIHTDTVAIYKATPGSSFLRLVTSLSKESVMENRSWDISSLPHIHRIIQENGVYQGDVWKKEPAIVMSIPYQAGGAIVLVIKKMPMAQMSLYYINILRTLFLLVSDSMARAGMYESACRDAKYVPGTDILHPQEFAKVLDLAQEKQKLGVADYILLRISGDEELTAKYNRVVSSFRELDQFGTDSRGLLYVLLSNASKEDQEAVLSRLAARKVAADPIINMAPEDFS